MKRTKKLGSKLIALMLALMMVAAYMPMVGDVAYASSPTIATDKTIYEVGEPIKVSSTGYSNGDWVAIYSANDTDADIEGKVVPSYFWHYPDGGFWDFFSYDCNSRDEMKNCLPEGKYRVVLLSSTETSYNIKAETEVEIVTRESDGIITTDKSTYNSGETVTVTVDYDCADSDWVALYKEGSGPWSQGSYSTYYNPKSAGKTYNFTDLEAGNYSIYLLLNDKYIFVDGTTFSIASSGNEEPPVEPDTPPVDPYEDYEIILEAEDTLTSAIDFGNGNLVDATYTQDFPKGLKLKVKAPEGVEYLWIGMYYHNGSEAGMSGAWAEVTSYASASAETATTIDLMDLIEVNDNSTGKINDHVQTYYSGWRKLVLFADGGKTSIADTKYIFVRPNESSATINLANTKVEYNGEMQTPVVERVNYCSDDVHGHPATAVPTSEYDVVIPENCKDVGTYDVVVNFKNRLGGTVTTTYSIVPKTITDDMVAAIADGEYDGTAVTPEVVVTDGETVLVKGTDYTVDYADNNKAGKATVTISGKGNYSGTVAKTFNLSCKHKWDEGEVTTEPTCTTEGVKTFTCQYGCGVTEPKPIPVNTEAHKWDEGTVTTEATCTEEGVKIFVCLHNAEHKDTAVIPVDAEAHKWDEGKVTTEATCTTEGVKTFVCLHNAEHKDTTAVPVDAEAHKWDEGKVTTEPTCTTEGVKTFVCLHNAEHKDTAAVPVDAEAHKWDEGKVTTEATCTTEGVKTFTCQHNTAHKDTAVIPVDKENHKYETVVTAPTCTEQGYTTYKCVCGDAYPADYVDAAGHKTVKTEAKAATCEVDGNIEYYTCEVCKKFFAEAEGKTELTADKLIVAAAGHTLGEFQTVEKAGFGKEGKQEAKCTACDYVEPKVIAAAVVPTLKSYTFNNKKKTPSVTVKNTDGSKVSIKTPYFYSKTRKSVGKYKVKVTLTGDNYSGYKYVYFKINPAGKSISKLTAGKKAFTVKWSKPSSTYRKQMSGYQIKYSTSSKMTSAKTVTVKGTSATSKTIKKLKAKKYYYVQLRTYKTVSGSKYYSDWSKTKKVKTK